MTINANCQTGIDFFEFLKQTNRTTIQNRYELKTIYNAEFRNRTPGNKDPNFSCVLYSLKICKRMHMRKDNVYFNFKAQVKSVYVDQWATPKQGPARSVQNGQPRSPIVPVVSSPEKAGKGTKSQKKLARLLISQLQVKWSELVTDRNGISIVSDSPFDNGKLVLRLENTLEHTLKLSLKNTGEQTIFFTYYTPLYWLKCLKLFDNHRVTKQNPLQLLPGASYEIQVEFKCQEVGFYPATLAFEFKHNLSSNAFYIVRTIEARCVTSLGLQLAPEAPYKPPSLIAGCTPLNCKIVDGQRPEGHSVMQLGYVVQLKPHKIPPHLNQLVTLLKLSSSCSDSRKSLLESPLSWENYKEKFQLMLHLEELQMVVDIKRYNIPNSDKDYAVLRVDPGNKRLLVLEVPGVSENRPSVLRGDSILVYPQGETSVKYCGYVHSVQLDSVKLGFASEFLDRFANHKNRIFIEGIKFNVEFTVNRLTVRLQHRAAELAQTKNLKSVLFPTPPPSTYPQPDLPKLSLFDRQLEKNPEQYQAVQHIVSGSSRPAPYLVFGPPGTGKTVTLVEAIKQIEKVQNNCHILACAPSNSAADLLCTKILNNVDHHKVYRMYASSRDPALVPEHLKNCSNLTGDCYVYPAKEKLMEYKILVTTLLSAGRLVSGDIPSGHFTHVFVDEAGHALETECLIPLAGLLDASCGQVVLAGDPKQLGPILRSPFALKYGMGISFLERLMSTIPLYQKNDNGLNNHFVTKLLRNYRSHPAILKVPNELFYDGELISSADEFCNLYCNWSHLPKKGFPVVFHGVAGEDLREQNSPSFFNVAEIEVLMDYVKKLLESQGKKGLAKLAPSDIGIIAPYRKQVQKIRKALEKVAKDFKCEGMDKLKVGSVEEFQGQERRVILVTTVRSSAKYMEIDRKFSLGFVKNEKRFNVAMTRAKALLIVVGNPVVLNTDTTWARFIQYCSAEEAFQGFLHDEEIDEVEQRFASLYVSIEPSAVETDESAVQQLQNPEWRHDI